MVATSTTSETRDDLCNEHYWLDVRCSECRRTFHSRAPHRVGLVYVNEETTRWSLLKRTRRHLNNGDSWIPFQATRTLLVSDMTSDGRRFFGTTYGIGTYPELASSDGKQNEYWLVCQSRHRVALTRQQIDTVVAHSTAGTLADDTVWARARRPKPLNL